MRISLVHVSHPPPALSFPDLEWMVRSKKSCYGVSEHSWPLLNSWGDKILGLGCHELGKSAIMSRIYPRALVPKYILSIWDTLFPDRMLSNGFQTLGLILILFSTKLKCFTYFCPKRPNLLDLAMLTSISANLRYCLLNLFVLNSCIGSTRLQPLLG